MITWVLLKYSETDYWSFLECYFNFVFQNEFNFPANEKDSILNLLRDQVKTWKKNIRNKYFGTTRESVLAYKNKVPKKVLVSVSTWNTFVERESTTEKLNQRLKAQENRSHKKDAHYLGRTSYAEKEAQAQVF